MKKLIVVGLLFSASVMAEGKLIPDTGYAVPIDQEIRERVFTACVKAINSQNIKEYEYLDDAISACGKEAVKIALRGQHTASDGYRYITAQPLEGK